MGMAFGPGFNIGTHSLLHFRVRDFRIFQSSLSIEKIALSFVPLPCSSGDMPGERDSAVPRKFIENDSRLLDSEFRVQTRRSHPNRFSARMADDLPYLPEAVEAERRRRPQAERHEQAGHPTSELRIRYGLEVRVFGKERSFAHRGRRYGTGIRVRKY